MSDGLQHASLSCSSPSLGECWNSCPLSWWCHPTISSSVVPFSSCLQSFPASGSFPMHISFPRWFKPLHTLYSGEALLRCTEGVSNHSSGSLVEVSAGGWGLSCIITLGLMGSLCDSTSDSQWCPLLIRSSVVFICLSCVIFPFPSLPAFSGSAFVELPGQSPFILLRCSWVNSGSVCFFMVLVNFPCLYSFPTRAEFVFLLDTLFWGLDVAQWVTVAMAATPGHLASSLSFMVLLIMLNHCLLHLDGL